MYLLVASALTLAVVFGISAAAKIGHTGFRAFVTSAGPLTVLAPSWRRLVGRLVVLVEVALVLLLAVAPLAAPVATAGLALAGVVLLAFTVAIGLSLERGERTACRCFGSDSRPLGALHLVRNAVLLAVVVAGLVGAGESAHPAGLVLSGVSGLVVGLLLTRIDDLVDLFAPR